MWFLIAILVLMFLIFISFGWAALIMTAGVWGIMYYQQKQLKECSCKTN